MGTPLMSAELNKKDVENLLKTYSSSLVKKAIRSSLDRTGTWAKKYLADDVSQNYNLSSARVKKAIKTIRTTQMKLESSLVISGQRTSLAKDFKAWQDDVGIKANISRKQVFSVPHAFIQKKSGTKIIMMRKGKPRYPTTGRPGLGPSMAALINRSSRRSKRDADMTDHLYKELQEQIAKRTLGGTQMPELE